MPLNVLFIEAFCGGSHAAFAKGLAAHSRHNVAILTMPARFWKWRMRGAALYLSPRIGDISRYDLVIGSNMMSLSDFTMLMGADMPPSILYFHESQLTYPLPPGAAMDMQFGFTDITSALAASHVCFNSAFHESLFFDTLPQFIRKMPEYYPDWVATAIRDKSEVRYPGVDLPGAAPPGDRDPDVPPLVVWNHRWEFDKNPGAFFEVLKTAAARGVDFRMAVLGENFQSCPQAFNDARADLADRIVAWGYEPDRSTYLNWLRQGDVVISTAVQENFGMSVIEAVHAGCLPLVPRRLAYPEIVPKACHPFCLYDDENELLEKLIGMLSRTDRAGAMRRELGNAMGRHAWPAVIEGYDAMMAAVAATGKRRS